MAMLAASLGSAPPCRPAPRGAQSPDKPAKPGPREAGGEQAEPARDPFHLHTTVVVVGTRSETELEKSPAASSVVTRGELELRAVRLVDQGLDLLPGVHAFRTKGAQDSAGGVGMRGFNARGSDGARVLVLLDGQPMNSAYDGAVQWTTLPVSEVDRVEVVRGPLSSLYGGNAMGGVINILTRPVERRRVDLSAQYGSRRSVLYSAGFSDRWWNRLGMRAGYHRLQDGGYPVQGVYASATSAAVLSGPLVTGAAPVLTTTGSQRYLVGEQGNNWYNQHAWWGRGEFAPGSRSTISLQFMRRSYGYGYDAYRSFLRDPAGNPADRGTVFFYDGGLRRVTLAPGNFIGGPGGGESRVIQAQLLHAFSPRSQVRVAGGMMDLPAEWFSTPASSASLSGGPGTTADRPNRARQGEAQWNWVASGRHSLVLGTEMRSNRSDSSEHDLAQYALRESRVRQTAASAGKDRSQALYAQDQVTVGGRLRLVASGRFDHWTDSAGMALPSAGAAAVRYPSRSADSLSGRLAAIAGGPAGWTLRAGVGNAFRNPTLYELFRTWRSASGTLYLSNPDLKPERLVSWEIGTRGKLGARFDLDAGYFENRVHNLIYRSTDLQRDPTGQTRVFLNAAQGRMRGAEIAATQRPFSWLQLRQSYGWNDARILRNDYAPLTAGKRVPYVPRNLAAFAAIAAHKQWTASLSGRYVGRIFSNDANSDTIKGVPGAYDPYFEMGGSVGWKLDDNVTLIISADNLLNRRYYEYYRAPGRTLNAGLRFHLN